MTRAEHGHDQHPEWEGAIVGLIAAGEAGLFAPDQFIAAASQAIVDLVRADLIRDYAEVQTFLRTQDAVIQLVARPFRPQDMPQPGIECRDARTGEQRGHWLMVSVGYNDGEPEIKRQLRDLAMSNEQNETALARDTGVLVATSRLLQ